MSRPPARLVRAPGATRLDLVEPPSRACPCDEHLVGPGLDLLDDHCRCSAAFEALSAPAPAPRVLGSYVFVDGGVEVPQAALPAVMALHSAQGVDYWQLTADGPQDFGPVERHVIRPGGRWPAGARLVATCPLAGAAGGVEVTDAGLTLPFGCKGSEDDLWMKLPDGDLAVVHDATLAEPLEVPPARALAAHVREKGRPVAGARVVVVGSLIQTGTTSARGVASFRLRGRDVVTVLASKDGHGDLDLVNLEEANGQVQLTLAAPLHVRGTVRLMPDGGGVPGVLVASHDAPGIEWTRSDDAGHYALDVSGGNGDDFGGPAGTRLASVEVADDAYVDGLSDVDGLAGATVEADVQVWRTVPSMAGRVLDQAGQPISGARVGLYLEDPRPHMVHLTDRYADADAKTDDAGRFVLDRKPLPIGRHGYVRVEHSEHPDAAEDVVVGGAPLELRMKPGAPLEAVILDPDGGRVSTGCLEIDGNGCYWPDDAGIFRGGWHGPGRMHVALKASGYDAEPSADVDVTTEHVTHLELHSGPHRADIQVTVVDRRGRPVPGATVDVFEPISQGSFHDRFVLERITADDSGHATVSRISHPNVDLCAERGDRQGPIVRATPGQTIQLVAP